MHPQQLRHAYPQRVPETDRMAQQAHRTASAGAGGAVACVPVRVVDPEDFELRRRGPFRSVRQLPGPGSPPPKPRARTVRRP